MLLLVGAGLDTGGRKPLVSSFYNTPLFKTGGWKVEDKRNTRCAMQRAAEATFL